MEILKISDSKIKIMLTPGDVKSFGFNIKNVDYNDIETRSAVWRLLDEAKKKCGFDAGQEKLLIQFYPSQDGGAELFVTKLSGLAKQSERRLSRSEGVTMLQTTKQIYNFASLGDLIRAAKTVKDMDYIKESELYYSDDEGYYLLVLGRGGSRLGDVSELAVLSEYSKRLPNALLPFVTEHCELIRSHDAIGLLSSLG